MKGKRIVPLLIGAALMIFAMGYAAGQAAAPMTKEAKVRQLLELTGTKNLGKQVLDGMINQFQSAPNLPPGFLEKFRELAKPDDLIDLIIPIYMKHLDDKTLDGTISFFMSPPGKSFVAEQPAMTKESMEAGAKWGRELAEKTLRSLDQGAR